VPGAPLVPILFLTQALNAVLLLPVLWVLRDAARDRGLMGEHALSAGGSVVTFAVMLLLGACVAVLAWLSL
jgi:Mn2+/Fe2+ NRAMP family transporter